MPNRKKYSNLSKRQVFRRLAAQSKADIHVLHNSSLQLANELQSEDDIFYIRQRLCEEKYNFQPKINIETGGIHDIVENEIDIENIEMNDEDNIIHQGYYMVGMTPIQKRNSKKIILMKTMFLILLKNYNRLRLILKLNTYI